MTDRQVIVVGGGGHGKVVISSLRAQGYKNCAVYDDDDSAKWGQMLMGFRSPGRLPDSASPIGTPR